MIARFASLCSLCKDHVNAGDDVRYDAESKTVQHWPCWENPKPGPAEYAIADRLGYRHYSWDKLR